MARLILTLNQPAARLPAVAGAKGAALAKMRSAGLSVPYGFVVTTEAFIRSDFTIPDHLDRQLAAVDPTDLKALEPLCRSARQAIAGRGVPDEVANAIVAAYRELGDGVAVAVRSSATAEDQPWASFAGQYDTFLNVMGHEALLDRLLEVWASLYSTRAVAYRLRLGIPHQSVNMAVVVQHQLRSEAAGVLFTCDPVTGDEGHYLVNAALGQGEGVVAGQIPSDSFSLDSRTWKVMARTVARKDSMLDLAPEGGLVKVEVAPARQESPALTDHHLAELGRVTHRVTQIFDGHQDIEFASLNGAIHLLQARPVTGVAEASPFPVVWEDPTDAEYTWVLGQGIFGQGLLYRLREDAARVYAESAGVGFQETGSPSVRQNIIRFFNGYAYTRSPETDKREVSERRRLYQARDRAYSQQGTSLYEAEIRPEVERILAEVTRFRPHGASLPELVHHLEQALQADGRVMGDLHWRMTAESHNDWPSTYHEITGEPPIASGILLQSIPNKTTQLVRWLRTLARLVQEDAALRTLFKERAYERLREALLRDRPVVRSFRARFRNLLRAYGLRSGLGFGSGISFTTPTWNMEPTLPLDLIATYARQDLDSLDRLEAKAKRSRKRAERRVRRMLASDPTRLQRFEQALRLAVTNLKRMEDHNHIMEQGVSGVFREAIFWLGQGMVSEGLLDHPDEVQHLSLDEIRDITNGSGPANVRALVRERTEEFQTRSRLQPPATVGRSGPVPPDPFSTMYDLPPDIGLDGLLLRGVGASPGKVTGRARVAAMSIEPPQVDQGDILVARNVGPVWTPILPLLGGLVLDEGAVFQHAALVAREYGIPAVIMTRDATTVIVDGQTITVDAQQGIVELIS